MTLLKQMALVLSLMIITILGSVVAINYKTAKEDMVENLYRTTVNNISKLTNKIAETGGEPILITSIIDFEFDSGYYKRIEFLSNDTSFFYKQENKNPLKDVPKWFVNFTDIHLKTVDADVISGWNLIGTLSVQANSSIIYEALYKTFSKLFYLFVVFTVISLIVLNIMLHFILKPLKQIQHQAEAILNNEFIIEKKEPYTTEFKEVFHAMNAMVKKVEGIFKQANQAAKRNQEMLYSDPVTKLFNRRYLMLKLSDIILLETKNEGGSIMLISLEGAEILNKRFGHKEADKFFYALAQIFKQACKNIEDKVISRVNGTEFTLMLPDCKSTLCETIAHNILKSFLALTKEYAINAQSIYINIGIYRYRPKVTTSELLTHADYALTQAKADESQHIYILKEKNPQDVLPKEKWRAILEESIERDYFKLKFWPTIHADTKEIQHKVMTFVIDAGEDKRFYYGDFIASAINLDLVRKIYLLTLKKLLTKQYQELNGTPCSIRLSNEFLRTSVAFEELKKLFDLYANKLNYKLYFEISDSFCTHNTAAVKNFVALFKQYNYGFGINAFSGQSNDYTYLKGLSPEFIKADVSFLLDQTQESMNALSVITKSLGIEIIANFVKDKEELEALQKLQIYQIQGPITDEFQL